MYMETCLFLCIHVKNKNKHISIYFLQLVPPFIHYIIMVMGIIALCQAVLAFFFLLCLPLSKKKQNNEPGAADYEAR